MPGDISLKTIPWQTLNMTHNIKRVRDSLGPEDTSSSRENIRDLEKTCSELESLFISYLLKQMRATVPKSGFMGGGQAEEIYSSMLDAQLARELSRERGIGISSLLLNRLGADPAGMKAKAVKK